MTQCPFCGAKAAGLKHWDCGTYLDADGEWIRGAWCEKAVLTETAERRRLLLQEVLDCGISYQSASAKYWETQIPNALRAAIEAETESNQ